MKKHSTTILITVVGGFAINFINPELFALRGIMMRNPFETFVVIGLLILIFLSLYDKFSKKLT